ncbi:MAG: GNAT family N-acetyltransferase [Nevskiaceae bacterium]|nr:MAG: GNAT family N-acetyltransferase [Nevskiaceae bacterium]TBR71643.1 MAG: GNAT family N-acetyltransferase [Nevskiaceae bacterium]
MTLEQDSRYLQSSTRFSVGFAQTPQEVLETQQLRYRIFAGELGATINGGEPDVDRDSYDEWCHHLLVRDLESGRVIACTRLLTDDQARCAGGFYSAGEFDLRMLDALPGRVLEVGRTCVDADYRNGAVIALLWSGLAEFVMRECFDYLFGCASIGLQDGAANAHALLQKIRARHMAPPWQRVRPHIALPAVDARPDGEVRMPPLLKAYFSLGGKACGEPYWDRDFHCADVFVLVNVSDLHGRYVRHFLRQGRVDGSTRVRPAVTAARPN